VELVDKGERFFAGVRLDWECKRTAADVVLDDRLFFDVDPRHQTFVRVRGAGGAPAEYVLRQGEQKITLARPVSLLEHARDYFVLGVEHIFTGYDHLGFLVGLLLVAGFASLRSGVRYLLGVVTAFTAAHSITLIASGLGWVRLPSHVVEPAIALSIFYVAVENLFVLQPRQRWLLTFGFGLMHGFGFASVLREIGLPARGLVLSLLSFNLGVEAGQIVVVSALAPLLWLAARPRFDCTRALRIGGSIVLALLSSFWFLERILGKSWLGGWLG
jgi:hypothetical protein